MVLKSSVDHPNAVHDSRKDRGLQLNSSQKALSCAHILFTSNPSKESHAELLEYMQVTWSILYLHFACVHASYKCHIFIIPC